MSVRGRLLVLGAVFVSACAAPTPSAPPSYAPSSTVLPTSSTSIPAHEPTDAPATPGAAQLVVIGSGQLTCNSPGGCGAALLMQRSEDGPLPSSLDYEAPLQFDIERPTIGLATLTGPVPGAPNTLAQGRWLLGLAQTFSSDFGTCDSPCSSIFFESGSVLLCDTALEVEPGTLAVRVRANFGEECSIAVDKLTAADASSLPLAQPVPVHSALLVVHGKGKCSIINYGSCQFVLLLTQDPTDLSTWQPGSDDLEFEQKALSFYAAKLTGAPPGLPSTIASGHWYVGLAVAQNSDVESEGRWGDVQCQTEFDVTGADDYALIKADYGPPCTVTAEIGPPPGS